MDRLKLGRVADDDHQRRDIVARTRPPADAKSSGPLAVQVCQLAKHSLRDVSLDLAVGERVAVLGLSGSGKSILLSCILGLNRPASGSVTVFGQRVNGRPLSRSGVGVAFQQPGLFDSDSIARNLALGAGRPISEEEARSWLDSVGLDGVSPEASPVVLSGGQRKRLAIARAMLRGNDLLLLDEPTSGLDPTTTRDVTRRLREHLDSRGVTLLLVTHDLGVARELCDRVVVLRGGVLVDSTLADDPFCHEAEDDRVPTSGSALQLPGGSRPPEHTAVPSQGFLAELARYLATNLPLSVAAMAMLGALLVAQTSGVGFTDMSPFVPGAIVAAVFRELAPLVVGLVLAGRIGAGIASHVGAMSYTAQIASMQILGVSTTRHLLAPRLVAAVIAFPMMILAGAFSALAAGGLSANFAWSGLRIGSERFFGLALDALDPALIVSCIVKGVLTGAAVVIVAIAIASRPVPSAPALGQAVTRATVLGIVGVIAIDVAVSWAFFT